MERFSIFFISRPVPGAQVWFYPHLCMWSTHRSLVLSLPWSSWVCSCEDRVQAWYDCLDRGSPSGAKWAGKPAAMGARDTALVRAFCHAWHKVCEGQPWPGFFWCTAGAWGPVLRGLFFKKLPCSWHMRASSEGACFIAWQPVGKSQPWVGFFYCCWQASACGEREVTTVAPPTVCDSAVVPCFHGSLAFLCRHSLLWISSLPSPQSISPHPTAVLAPSLFSNPHKRAPSLLAHLWTHIPVRGM